jgi:uncharacterized membrane protein YjgN (DUF898 family)
MTTLTIPAAQPLAAPMRKPAGPVRFLGFDRDYMRLLIRGSVLLALTLGIYRFWLHTDMRRFLWSNTEVLGEPLEYTGTARELLIGFLIAVAILIPLYVLIFVLALSYGPIGQFAGAIGFIVVTVLGHYAVYRARRYRLTRTIYRGVRFHQTGSAWNYAIRAVLWWIAIGVTIGLAYPFAQASLERYKMKNTWLGNLQGRFAGSGWRLFFRGLFLWLVVIGPLVGAIVALIASFDTSLVGELAQGGGENAIKRFVETHPRFSMAIGASVGALIWSLLLAPLLYPVFQAILLRWWVSGLRFGDLAATSRLHKSGVYGAYLRFVGWSIVFSMIGGIIISICIVVIGLLIGDSASELKEVAAAVVGVAGYIVIALAYSILYQVKVRLGLWRLVAESADLTNSAVLENISSVGAPASPVGEGLADALNVGGF